MFKKISLKRVGKKTSFFAISIFLGTFASSIILADSFNGPTASPPANNAPVPINDTGSSQIKSGGLSLGSLIVNGGSVFNGIPLFNGNGYSSFRFTDGLDGRILFDYGTGTTDDLRILTGTGVSGSEIWTERFRLTSAGNVGIGTSSPTRKLTVEGGGYLFGLNGAGTVDKRKYSFYQDTDRLRIIATNDANSYVRDLFTFKHDGNVGIGTTNPEYKLTVVKSTSAEVAIIGGSNNYSILRLANGPWIMGGGDTYSGYGGVKALSLYSPKTIWFRAGTAERMRITEAGNVGIGTATPGYKLDVSGDINFTGDLYKNGVLFGTGSNLWTESGSNIYRNTGNVGIGTSTPGATLEVYEDSNSGWRFGEHPSYVGYSAIWNSARGNGVGSYVLLADSANTFINSYGAGKIFFRNDNGPSIMTIMENGNVGIGTSAPEAKLHVNGPIKYSKGSMGLISTVSENGWLRDAWLAGNTFTQVRWDNSSKTWKRNVGAASTYGYNDFGGILFNSASMQFIGEPLGSVGEWTNSNFKTDTVLMTLNYDGNVGIGTNYPTVKLDINSTMATGLQVSGSHVNNTNIKIVNTSTGGRIWALKSLGENGVPGPGGFKIDDNTAVATRFFIDTLGNIGIGTTSPVQKLDVNGNVQATAYYYSSDQKLKKNIETINNSLNKISQLRGVDFNWKKDSKKSMGFVAQEVEKVLPELVNTGKNGYKSVQYGNITALLLEGVKELKVENDQLREENKNILKRLEKLEKSLK